MVKLKQSRSVCKAILQKALQGNWPRSSTIVPRKLHRLYILMPPLLLFLLYIKGQPLFCHYSLGTSGFSFGTPGHSGHPYLPLHQCSNMHFTDMASLLFFQGPTVMSPPPSVLGPPCRYPALTQAFSHRASMCLCLT